MNPLLNLYGDSYDFCTPKEIDIEASAHIGNRIFWMGSLGNSPEGEFRPNRNRLFATDLSGTNINSYALSYAGRYEHLKEDLLDWDHRGLHGKGQDYYGLVDSAATGKLPSLIDSFNVEGLAMAPDGRTAYIGFRAPYVPPSNRTRALVAPLLNLPALVGGNPASGTNADGSGLAVLGEAIELNLGGRGIRSIEGNSNGMLIVAGPADNALNFRLFTWTGNRKDAPQERLADLRGMIPEGIVEIPDGPLGDNSVIQIVSDNGAVAWYGDGVAAKNVPDAFTKFRSDRVTLGPVIPQVMGAKYIAGSSFSFSILGRSGSQYSIESSDGGLESWTARGTVWIPEGDSVSGTARWLDSNLPGSGTARFYRAIEE